MNLDEIVLGKTIPGQTWVKLDSHLPISGSIKARSRHSWHNHTDDTVQVIFAVTPPTF